MPDERPVEYVKVKDLTPESKNVNIVVKVVEEGEERSISSKFGGERKLKEFTVGDESGVVVMTLWEDQVSQASDGDTLQIENGYISLVRGNMRLNIGKYGKFMKAKEELSGDVNKELNMSAKEYPIPERRGRAGTGFTRYGGLSDYYPRQGGGGGGGGRRDDDRGGGGGGRDGGDRRRRDRNRY